jgi:methionyl-tRNA formyltransferase
MVVDSFRKQGLEFSLILEGRTRQATLTERILGKPLAIYKALTSGRFKALPKISFFTMKAFLRERAFSRSQAGRTILDRFQSVRLEGVRVPSINHVKTLKFIQDGGFDIGILAGVGIVDEIIINAFSRYCLNAHPAPLPQCRGGGALVNTLAYGLQPAVSVHLATAGIDEGGILVVQPLKLQKGDSYESVNLRLAVLCAETLAMVAARIVSGCVIEPETNSGKLHFWKDCTISRQRQAERTLKAMLRELSDI